MLCSFTLMLGECGAWEFRVVLSAWICVFALASSLILLPLAIQGLHFWSAETGQQLLLARLQGAPGPWRGAAYLRLNWF